MQTLTMPKAAEPWSLTRLREKLIKIGAKVAPADVPGNPVAHRPVAGAAGTSMTGRRGQMREITTAEVRP